MLSNAELWAFIDNFEAVQEECFHIACEHGFHDVDAGNPCRIALIHSELSECLEALRCGDPQDNKLPEFKNSVIEAADAVIRLMDLAAKNKWPLADAIVSKMNYNRTRRHKHGGKAF